MIGILVNLSMMALNVYMFYYFGGHWWSLAAALFCSASMGACIAFKQTAKW